MYQYAKSSVVTTDTIRLLVYKAYISVNANPLFSYCFVMIRFCDKRKLLLKAIRGNQINTNPGIGFQQSRNARMEKRVRDWKPLMQCYSLYAVCAFKITTVN